MYESEIRKIFKEHSYLLNDVAGVEYPKGKIVDGFHHRSVYSCDNIILWMLCHDTNQDDIGKNGTTVGFAVTTIREIFRKYVERPNVKFIGRGRDKKSDPFHEKIHKKKKKYLKMTDKYIPGYIAVKITLSDIFLPVAHSMLNLAMNDLKKSFVVLHDIDIFTDCGGITNRTIVQEYLLEKDVSIQSIINDRSKVGDDCISWMVGDGRKNKVYNKFIQMLQSCDVRKAMGSIIADLVYNTDPKFTRKLLKYQEKGISRVESTFYSNILEPIEYYTNKMDNLLEFLEECPVYYVSFEKQWKRLSRRIESSFAIYISNKKIFAYSHWWNSITGKIQGYSKSQSCKKEIVKLLANYSFNDRPMYFIKGKLHRDGTFEATKKKTYFRDGDSTAITLVPGPNRSLYPSFERLERNALSFDDVGIVSYKNITIGWPKKRLRRTTKALAKIFSKKGIPTVEELDDSFFRCENKKEEDTNNLREINISMEGRFQSSYTLVENESKTYTIVGYGYRKYYGNLVLHLLALDGTKIRCTNNLQSKVNGEISKGVRFQVKIIKPITIGKYRDVKCKIVRS